jgi:hypothetical protein
MQSTIVVGSAVHCTDGKGGSVVGVVINPNISRLDYLILDPGPLGGRERYVPIGQVERADRADVLLPISCAELGSLPGPTLRPEQGTVQDNLPDLCVARAQTPVKIADGTTLGHFYGVALDDNFQIERVLLDENRETGIVIERVERYSHDELTVQLAQQVADAGTIRK